MSFYLLPPVSYQTQQKMKARMDKDKKKKKEKRQNSMQSTSSSHSIHSAATSVSNTTSHNPYNKTSTSSMIHDSYNTSNQSLRTPSISSKSPNMNYMAPNRLFNRPNKSIDELSNLDSVSIASDITRDNGSIKEPLIKKDDKKDKKDKFHTFNYNYNSDLNEIIKYQVKHRPSIKSNKSTNSSIYSRESGNSHITQPSYINKHYDNYHAVEFNIPNYTTKLDKYDNLSNYSIAPDLSPEVEKFDIVIDDGDVDDDVVLNDEDEVNKLTRVYSDVDSIFSTKIDTPKRGLFRH